MRVEINPEILRWACERAEFIPTNKTEIWCNKVAAEMLVPTGIFKAQFNSSNELSDEYCRLAKVFKVSTLVIIRRIFDCGFITENTFQTVYCLLSVI
jgi:Zn-dependent peptidase ImmA (M78 family)